MKTANALKSKQHKIKLSFLLLGQLETDQSLGVTNYNALADVKSPSKTLHGFQCPHLTQS